VLVLVLVIVIVIAVWQVLVKVVELVIDQKEFVYVGVI
jgi:hypothetical protein